MAGTQKKSRLEGRVIVFIDESGLSERPTRVRTWAPRDQTPVIRFHFGWTHVSAIAALSRTGCMFHSEKRYSRITGWWNVTFAPTLTEFAGVSHGSGVPELAALL